jgi:hypothetical protein
MNEQEMTPGEAMGEYNRAQADEAEARMRGGDPVATMEAKSRQVRAMDTIAAAGRPEEEEKVTLVSPNPYATVVDSNGVAFVDGRAEGVPRSLAQRYVVDFGYTIEED